MMTLELPKTGGQGGTIDLMADLEMVERGITKGRWADLPPPLALYFWVRASSLRERAE